MTTRAPASAARSTIAASVARSHGHGPIERSDCSSMATIIVASGARGGSNRRAMSRARSSSALRAFDASSNMTATPAAAAIKSAVRLRSMGRMVARREEPLPSW